MTMTQYVSDWLERGEEDLETAKILLDAKDIPNQVCFHAQQAAKKYIKGFFAYHEKNIRKTHDLAALIAVGIVFDDSLKILREDAAFLGQFYIQSRYPDDYRQFTRDEAEAALAAARRIKDFVVGKISRLSTP